MFRVRFELLTLTSPRCYSLEGFRLRRLIKMCLLRFTVCVSAFSVCVCVCFIFPLSLFLFYSTTHPHTHTHTSINTKNKRMLVYYCYGLHWDMWEPGYRRAGGHQAQGKPWNKIYLIIPKENQEQNLSVTTVKMPQKPRMSHSWTRGRYASPAWMPETPERWCVSIRFSLTEECLTI